MPDISGMLTRKAVIRLPSLRDAYSENSALKRRTIKFLRSMVKFGAVVAEDGGRLFEVSEGASGELVANPMTQAAAGLVVTAELARAWLDTVVTPLMDGLRQANFFLMRQNPTWRWRQKVCAFVSFCVEYVPQQYQPNFDDLCRRNAEVKAAIDAHNAALGELHASLEQAHKTIALSPAFADAWARARDNYGKNPWGSTPEPEGVYEAAECVVNRVPTTDLSHNYSYAEFWMKYGMSLIKAARDAAASNLDESSRLIVAVGAAGAHIMKVLENERARLCDTLGIPPVPVTETKPVEETF
jgi:hypothetical protein